MSVYHIVFIALVFGAVWEHIKGKTPGKYFLFMFFALAAMLCFRFGQGPDYFNYAHIYHSLPINPIEAIQNKGIHTEPGWKILCCLFKAMQSPFPVFIGVVSAYMIVMFYRFLRMYGGERKMLALVLCYHTMYMSYFSGALRQGVVIATLLGLLLPLAVKRKYISYCVAVLLLSTIHSVALLLLLLPMLQCVKLTFKQTVCLTAVGFLLGVLFTMIDIDLMLNKIRPHMYFADAQVSVFAIVERVFTFAIVTFCCYTYWEGLEPSAKDPVLALYKFYAIGLFLYGLLMWSALISSRTSYVLKVIEIVLICICIVKCKKSRTIVLCYCLVLSVFLYVKNIDSYLLQGQYQNTTVISYPYVSVFNQKDILNYRQDTIGYPFQ